MSRFSPFPLLQKLPLLACTALLSAASMTTGLSGTLTITLPFPTPTPPSGGIIFVGPTPTPAPTPGPTPAPPDPGFGPHVKVVNNLLVNSEDFISFRLNDPTAIPGTESTYYIVHDDVFLNGVIDIDAGPDFGIGSYKIAHYGDSFSGTPKYGYVLGQYDYGIDSSTPGDLSLVVSAANALYWNGSSSASAPAYGAGGDGSWSAVNTNWAPTEGGQTVVWDSAKAAIFAGTAGTVSVIDHLTSTGIRFLTDGYTIEDGGGSISSTGDFNLFAAEEVQGTISADLFVDPSGSLVKYGAGDVTLSGTNTINTASVLAGGLYFGSDDSAPTGNLSLFYGTTIGVRGSGPLSIAATTSFGGNNIIDAREGAISFQGETFFSAAVSPLLVILGSSVDFSGRIYGSFNEEIVALSLQTDGAYTPTVTFSGSRDTMSYGIIEVGPQVTLKIAKDPGAVGIDGPVYVQDGGKLLVTYGASSPVTPISPDSYIALASGGSLVFDNALSPSTDSYDQHLSGLYGEGLVDSIGEDVNLHVHSGFFEGQITGNVNLFVPDDSPLYLSGANSYSGYTDIRGAIFADNLSALGTGTTYLRGEGTLVLYSPLQISRLRLDGGAIVMQLDSSTASQLNVTGGVSLITDEPFYLGLVLGQDFAPGRKYDLITAASFDPEFLDVLQSEPINNLIPTFFLENNILSVVYNFTPAPSHPQYYSGSHLINVGPYAVPTWGNFLVEGTVVAGSPNQSTTINGLAFDQDSLLFIFNTLTVTSGNFDARGDATITGGILATPGDFTKVGNGFLTIGSTINAEGNIIVQAGGLGIFGTANTPQLIVRQGAFLGGTGVINGDLLNQGTLNPGASPGTLTVNGDFDQESSGTFVLEVASPSVFDQLIVSGTASLAGTLDVQNYEGNTLSYGQQIPFLYADSIEGDFDQIVMPDPSIFRGRFLNEDGEGILLVAPTSYTLVAKTQNQANVAAALDGFIPATSGDRQEVSIALDVMTADQYPAAFDQISPAFYESLADITLEQNNAQNQMLAQRFSSVRLGARGFQSMGVAQNPIVNDKDGKSVLDAKSTKDIITPTEDNKWGLWVMGNGLFANAPSVNQMPSYKFQSGGFLGGVDYAWSEHFATGVFAGYQGLYAKYNGGAKNTINSTNFGTYATFQHSGFTADAIVSGAYNNYSTRRPIEFSTVDRTATANPDGGQVNAYLGLGYDWQVGNFTFGPILSAQYTYVGIGSFTENNAGSLDLKVDQQNAHSIRTSLGGRIAYTWKLTEHITLIPEGRMLWQHEYLNGPRTIGASLDGGAGSSFDYLTAAPGRDAVYAGAGVTAQFGPNWNANLFYNADFGRQDYISHMVSGGLTWEF